MTAFRNVMAGLAVAGAMFASAATAQADDGGKKFGGLYIGASIGWMGSSTDWNYVNAIDDRYHFSHDHDTGIYGGHIGFQHQFDRGFVLGVEAAFSGNGVFENGDNKWSGYACPNTTYDCQTRMNNIFTVGGRAGYAINSVLLFVNGGFASASVNSRGVDISNHLNSIELTSERHNGGYIGGGVEYAITSNLIVGVEYQHLFLGDRLHCPYGTCDVNPSRSLDTDIDIVRARLSFKLGRAEETYVPMK